MRKVTYGAACSLDGFITGPDGALDWLHFSDDAMAIMNETWAKADTVLMGRRTWEVAAAAAPPGGGGMPGVSGYVFSRTLERLPDGHGTLVRSDAGEFVRELTRKPGKDICVLGGSELAASLFRADVIDEVGLNVHPVLLGSGVPLFRDAGRIALELVESRPIAGGCVYLLYRVRHARAARN
jgi:dihydrofolate reductase